MKHLIIILFILFIYGCPGSSLLDVGFLQLQGLLLAAGHRPLIVVASLAAEHGLWAPQSSVVWHTGLVTPKHVESSQTRKGTCLLHLQVDSETQDNCGSLPLFFFVFVFFFDCKANEILVPLTGIEPKPSVVRALSPNHWPIRKFLIITEGQSRIETTVQIALNISHLSSSQYAMVLMMYAETNKTRKSDFLRTGKNPVSIISWQNTLNYSDFF